MCDQCFVDAKKLFGKWRLSVWEDILDLPAWEELEQSRMEDLGGARVGHPDGVPVLRS